jgi:ribonuclease HI
MGLIKHHNRCKCEINFLYTIKTKKRFHKIIMTYYAVYRGHNSGVYETWEEAQAQMKGAKGSQCQKFKDIEQALEFVENGRKKEQNHHVFEKPKAQFIQPKKRIGGTSDFVSTDINQILYEASKRGKKREREEIQWNEAIQTKKQKLSESAAEHGLTIYHVFTDGACLNNGSSTKKSYAGVGIYCTQKPEWNLSEPFTLEPITNQRAELYAILLMLIQWDNFMKDTTDPDQHQLCIWTDSQYSINCITKWIPGWIKRDWVTTNGTPVINQDLIKDVYSLFLKHPTTRFEHVHGHKNITDNEEADRRASEAAARQIENTTVE